MQRDEGVLNDVLGAGEVVDEQHGQAHQVPPVQAVETGDVDLAAGTGVGPDRVEIATRGHADKGCHIAY